MLNQNVIGRRLFAAWKQDASLAFACAASPNGLNRSSKIHSWLRKMDLTPLTAMTMRLLRSLDGKPLFKDEASKAKLAEAEQIFRNMETADGRNHLALDNRAVSLLSHGHLETIQDFCQWAIRASTKKQDKAYLWGKKTWEDLQQKIEALPIATVKQINDQLAIYASNGESNQSRAAALCLFYELLFTCVYEASDPPAILTRLMVNMLNALFCWPLLVAEMGLEPFAISLPVFAELQAIRRQTEYSRPVCRGAKFITVDQGGVTWHGFEDKYLAWDSDFQQGLNKGVRTAIHLWKTQNGRQLEKDDEKCLELDFSFACEILGEWLTAPLYVGGRSAEAYWAQVALGLMLPEQRIPLGVCSGTIEDPDRNGEYLLGSIEGVALKLAYASQIGALNKLVLPSTDRVKAQIEEAFAAEDQEKRQEIRTGLLENCLCYSVRNAADVMQTSGWRRARFVSTPRVSQAYSRMTRNLFELGREGLAGDEKLDFDHPLRPCINEYKWDEGKIAQIDLGYKSQVRFVSSNRMSEEKLGLWIAKIDHEIRQQGAPGLGILAIKTLEGESDMRFWAQIFEELNVSDTVWNEFQFGDIEASSKSLASVLNNFSANKEISRQAPPDLLLIIDEAGATQKWGKDGKQEFQDPRGNLLHLLNTAYNTRALGRQHYFANNLAVRDEIREAVLGDIRVIIVYPRNEPQRQEWGPLTDTQINTKNGLGMVLRIFRNGFTVHGARMVLDSYFYTLNRKLFKWSEFLAFINYLKKKQFLSYSRGEYCVEKNWPLDPRLPHIDKLHEAAGLAFAPSISTGEQNLFNRRIEMTPAAAREAAWHFQQMYRLASTKEIKDRARKHRSTLAFLIPREDWDTVQAYSFDKQTFGTTANDLALHLLHKNPAPHPSNCGRALNSFMAKVAKKQTETLRQHLNAYDQIAQRMINSYRGTQYESLIISMVDSEKAAILQWVIENGHLRHAPELWDRLHDDLKSLNHRLSAHISDLWNGASSDRIWLAHSWLERQSNRVQAEAAFLVKYAYANCATEGSPTARAWAQLVALTSTNALVLDLRHVLDLWDKKITRPVEFQALVNAEFCYQNDVLLKTHFLKDREKAQLAINALSTACRNLMAWSRVSQRFHTRRGGYEAKLQSMMNCFSDIPAL